MRWAMILAAGRGERMRPLTDSKPKPLMNVNSKPLIIYHIESLVASGVSDIVINVSYLGDMIKKELGNGENWGVNIHYSDEPGGPLETAGGIYNALSFFNNDPFLVINSDVWTDYDFSNLLNYPLNEKLAHLVLTANPEHNSDGDFILNADNLLSHEGKAQRLTFTGLSVMSAKLFENNNSLKNYYKKKSLTPILKGAMANRRISGELYSGDWIDVGSIDRFERLCNRFI